MITLKDIAREAGVNTTTVSRALRNDPGLNTETVERIRVIARKMNYIPKRRKNLELGPVCIICPEINGGIYPRLATGISARMVKYGIECFVEISHFNEEREKELLRLWSRRKVSGIVIMTENDGISPIIEKCINKYSIPIVQIAMSIETHAHDNIWVDEQVGINKAIDYLTTLGHADIAFLGSEYCQKRLSCFKKSMAAYGLKIENMIKISKLTSFQCGYETMAELLKEKKQPTAIIAEYDDIAIGAIRRMYEAGFQVPNDYSIIGFDDSIYCSFFPVSLTSIENFTDSLCETTYNLMIKKIKDPSFRVAQSVLIKPNLVIRESTGPV